MSQSIRGLIERLIRELPIPLYDCTPAGEFFNNLLESFDQGTLREITGERDKILSRFDY